MPGQTPLPGRFSEEVINVTLARLLAKRGLAATPEQVVGGRARPDVMVFMNGLRLVIEGRHVSQRQSLRKDAEERVTQDVADISIGVLYPDALYRLSLSELEQQLETHPLEGMVYHRDRSGTLVALHDRHFTLERLVEIIMHATDIYIKNDLVSDHVNRLEQSIQAVVDQAMQGGLHFRSEVLIEKLENALGLTRRHRQNAADDDQDEEEGDADDDVDAADES